MIDYCLANLANIFTIALAGAAIFAGWLAFKNLGVLKEQQRMNTLLKLIDQMSSQRERDNRGVVHSLWEDKEWISGLMKITNIGQRIAKLIDDAHHLEQERARDKGARIIIRKKEAIEETISCLDKVGFFLLGHPPKLKVDPKLRDEAPTWIWSITLDMWNELGDYVKGVQEGSLKRKISEEGRANPNYGRYFKALSDAAKKKSSG
jgi:hypothetical protein